MQLPKYKKKRRVKLKVCREPGCGKEYWGHPISKYCELHRDIKSRQKRKKIFEKPDVKNQVFKHNFPEVTTVEFTCYLNGCSTKYTIPVHPKQYIYPKYCPEHRNAFKRDLFARQNPGA